MSPSLDAAPPLAPSPPPADPRSARLKAFAREQAIVDFLNRGVSVAEIATHMGLSEKRTRAVIRETLARRMPHAPMEFAAIQVSRLNEALLVAYSAMSGANLNAVDRVVRIVRELDRYHGFAAVVRRSEAERTEARVDAAATFGPALFCRAQLAPGGEEGDLAFEKDVACGVEARGLPPADSARFAGDHEDRPLSAPARDGRPESPLQDLEKVDSAPGPAAPKVPGVERPDLVLSPSKDVSEAPMAEAAPQKEGGDFALAAPAGERRPQNPPQDLEKVDSAPGLAAIPETEPREVLPSQSKDAPAAATGPSPLRDATPRLAPRQEAEDFAPAALSGEDGPGNPPEALEKVDSAPGCPNDEAGDAAPAPVERPFDTPMILTPSGWKRQSLRITRNGVMAC